MWLRVVLDLELARWAGVVVPQLGSPLFQVVPGRVSVQVPRAVLVRRALADLVFLRALNFDPCRCDKYTIVSMCQ